MSDWLQDTLSRLTRDPIDATFELRMHHDRLTPEVVAQLRLRATQAQVMSAMSLAQQASDDASLASSNERIAENNALLTSLGASSMSYHSSSGSVFTFIAVMWQSEWIACTFAAWIGEHHGDPPFPSSARTMGVEILNRARPVKDGVEVLRSTPLGVLPFLPELASLIEGIDSVVGPLVNQIARWRGTQSTSMLERAIMPFVLLAVPRHELYPWMICRASPQDRLPALRRVFAVALEQAWLARHDREQAWVHLQHATWIAGQTPELDDDVAALRLEFELFGIRPDPQVFADISIRLEAIIVSEWMPPAALDLTALLEVASGEAGTVAAGRMMALAERARTRAEGVLCGGQVSRDAWGTWALACARFDAEHGQRERASLLLDAYARDFGEHQREYQFARAVFENVAERSRVSSELEHDVPRHPSALSVAAIVQLLRTGTPAQRAAFVRSLPPTAFEAEVVERIQSPNPAMVVVGLARLVEVYCRGLDPQLGAVLAAAAHEHGRMACEDEPNHGLLPLTLSGLAHSHLCALGLLGQHRELIELADRYISRYADEPTNCPSLRAERANALLELGDLDGAKRALDHPSLRDHFGAQCTAKRVDALLRDATVTVVEARTLTPSLDLETQLDALKDLVAATEGELLASELEELVKTKEANLQDLEQFRRFVDKLGHLEDALLTRGSDEMSELTVRRRIRELGVQFKGKPTPEALRRSLAELGRCFVWCHENCHRTLENDALWRIYLCYSNLDQPSEAADTLISLRTNLEEQRRGIADPMKRAGIFSRYPHLFGALCTKLYAAGRHAALLEAIESSKGRVIADRLTQSGRDAVGESAIYHCLRNLPSLTQSEGFHYLSYFVDDERVYAVLLTKRGEFIAPEPMVFTRSTLRGFALAVEPSRWGKPNPSTPGTKILDISRELAPLVTWLEGVLRAGVICQGDHVCYSLDAELLNIPLHYLRFGGGILLDAFSLSRVQTAFELDRLLRRPITRPTRYVSFAVPLRQDLAKSSEFQAKLDAPPQRLEAHGLSGTQFRLEEATLEQLLGEALDHRVVHFSTHGWFPPSGTANPFRESYLLLADSNGLPDIDVVLRGEYGARLTPSAILERGLDLQGSHLSMMACVSGLAREGIGGDALGLDWALLQGGASSIVSTHWKVSAESAALLFGLFYDRWLAGGRTRAAALREATLELLGDARDANALRHWTAFSLTGDFRA